MQSQPDQRSSGTHWGVLFGLLFGGFILGGFTVGIIMAASGDAEQRSANDPSNNDGLASYVEGALDEYDEGETPEEAVARYTAEMERRPDAAELYLWRGGAYEDLFEYELANDDYTTAIELDPDRIEFYEARAVLNFWRDSELAATDYLTMIEMAPDVARHRASLGSVYEELGDDDAALEQYALAIELAPDSVDAYSRRARLNLVVGNGPEAIDDFTVLVEDDPAAWSYGQRGSAHVRLENYPAAIDDYTEAYRLDEGSTYYLQQRAGAHAASGDIDAAIDDYTEAIATESSWGPYGDRADLLWQQGRYDEALADYDQAVAIDDLSGRYRRGLALAELGRNEEALVDLDEVVDVGLVDYGYGYDYDYLAYEYYILMEDVLYARATVQANLGDYPSAISDLEMMVAWHAGKAGAPRPQLLESTVEQWIDDLENGVNPFN